MKYGFLLMGMMGLAQGQSLGQALQMATAGVYDNLKTSRDKGENKRKIVTWAKGLAALKASYAQVSYVPDNRTQTWYMVLKNYQAPLADYVGQIKNIGSVEGAKLAVVQGGLFDQALVLHSKNQIDIYSQGYSLYFKPELYTLYKTCKKDKKC